MRACGYIPDPVGLRRTPVRHLLARAPAAVSLAFVNLAVFAPPVMDQGETGSCTGHATAAAIATARASAQAPLGWVPSPAGIYTLARCIDRPGPSVALTDDGAQPNQVFRGIAEWGIRPMGARPADGRFSDADPATINAEPMLGDVEADSVDLGIGDYGIASTGAERIADLRGALAAGKPVTAAIAGGSAAFQQYAGGILGPLYAALDHYIMLVGYDTDANGATVFHGRNSWSEGWGEEGNFRLNEGAAQELGDLIAVDASTKGVRR